MIARHPFGRTGQVSTRTIFGGAALSRVSQDDADRTLEVLLRYGVNHIDTAASYGDSELRIGPWMEKHRGDFFLATKTGERTYEGARESIQRSLERLRVDHVDLLQLHNLVAEDEWATAFAAGGALEAAVEAREKGLTRFIGVTGHGVTVAAMHRRSLERFDFDSVLLPYNFMMMKNPQYAADFEALVEVCEQRGVAVQTIKGITLGPWGEKERTTTTWYEPFEDDSDLDMAVRWVLGRPGVFLNTASDIRLLPKVLAAADDLGPRPSDAEMESLADRRSMAPLFV